MNKAGFLFLGAVMSMGSLLFVQTGCGDDTGTGGTGGSGGDGSTTTSKTTTGSTSASTSAASGGGVAATCTGYCASLKTNCTGDNAQFPAADHDATCAAACAQFEQGDKGATAGNSLECRNYHAGDPAKGMAAMHCNHAGVTGGDLDPTATGMGKDGPCGDGVAAFCKLAVATCKAQPMAWQTEAECVTDATKFKASTTPFSAVKDTAGDTFNCRAYHLTVASKDATNAGTHCAHIKLDSAPCK